VLNTTALSLLNCRDSLRVNQLIAGCLCVVCVRVRGLVSKRIYGWRRWGGTWASVRHQRGGRGWPCWPRRRWY